MDYKATLSESDEESDGEYQTHASLENGGRRLASKALELLPATLLRIVRDYLSDNTKDRIVKNALLDEQPITLCLSQNENLTLASSWYMGFFPRERQWQGFVNVQVDKEFSITDQKSCVFFLNEKSSQYCRFVVDVLVLKLSMVTRDSRHVFDDLRCTIGALQGHLNSVKYVVISLTEYASCCFSLPTFIDMKTGLPQPLSHQQALYQIVDDLSPLWNLNRTLSVSDVLALYFKGDTRPASEKYLAKFVISLNNPLCPAPITEEASKPLSDKIMWCYDLESLEQWDHIKRDATRFCHAVHLNMLARRPQVINLYAPRLKHAFDYRDNPFVERIFIQSSVPGHKFHLPRPSAPITDLTRLSALVEIKLIGGAKVLSLNDLNSGYFPCLAHLTVIKGNITGHLDSHRVPLLKTLVLEVVREGSNFLPVFSPLMRKHCHSLLKTGYPWQLVTTKTDGGWSLASYEAPSTNPHDEVKEDSSDSPYLMPFIRDLMLVGSESAHSEEWNSLLRNGRPVGAAVADPKNRLLIWAPERVEKISLYGTKVSKIHLRFLDYLPCDVYSLSSLSCHDASMALKGEILPHLKSLEVTDSVLGIFGAFRQLETLSLNESRVEYEYRLITPMLKSFSCNIVDCASNLMLDTQQLPHLSFLCLTPLSPRNDLHHPIFEKMDSKLGLSQFKHVVFNKPMTRFHFFEEYRASQIIHLQLVLDAFELPACWHNAVWQCETLNVHIYADTCCLSKGRKPDIVVFPPLPQVKKLRVTYRDCHVLINKEMPELVECTLSSPALLGEGSSCPALKRIYFSGKLSKSVKAKCLNPATYRAVGAHPEKVFFEEECTLHKIDWDYIPKESEAQPLDEDLSESETLPLAESLNESDNFFSLTRASHSLLSQPVSHAMILGCGLGLLIFSLHKYDQRSRYRRQS